MSVLHSVIIPVLNGQRYVGEAIASALAQIGDGDEILVVDNGSTDDTREIVGGHVDARVRLFVLPEPSVSAARNHGVRQSRGQFISFLDHDDLWPPGRQEGLFQAIQTTRGAEASHGRIRMLYEPEAASDVDRYGDLDGQHVRLTSSVVYMFRRSLIDRVGPFDESMKLGEDTDFAQRASQAGMISALYDGDALIYRRHLGNSTRDHGAMKRATLDVIRRNLQRMRNTSGEAK